MNATKKNKLHNCAAWFRTIEYGTTYKGSHEKASTLLPSKNDSYTLTQE